MSSPLPMAAPAPIDDLIAPAVQAAMQAEIAAAGGSEVVFHGTVDARGVVVAVEVGSRGHASAAPALPRRIAEAFDLCLHNHPSGDLRPSEADLRVAHHLGEQGVGFVIVSDDVSRAYVVVPPRARRSESPVDAEEVAAFLAPGGPLSGVLGDDYEPRPGQTRMAAAVSDALNTDRVALLESGTGTGKTFAYLVPAALHALRNGEKVVVSTATINLQGQLASKDVPHLKAALGEAELEAVVVKGRGNYVSLRRAEEAAAADALEFGSDAEREEVVKLTSWARTTPTGDRSELTPPPSADAWEHVSSTSDNCLGTRCPRYGDCHYYTSRRAAAQAQLLIVNHHLLFADLAIKQEVGFDNAAALPPFTRVVLDEAHHVEGIASEHFGLSATQLGLNRPLGRLRRKKRAKRGLLPSLIAGLAATPNLGDLAVAAEQLLSLRDRAAGELESAFAEATDRVQQELERSEGSPVGTLRLNEERNALLDPLAEALRALSLLSDRIGRFAEELSGSIVGESARKRLGGRLAELRSVSKRLTRGAHSLEQILRPVDPDKAVRWVEVRKTRRGSDLRLRSAPLEVGPQLREALFARARSVILSSATLTVGQRFDFLERRLGLDATPERLLRDVIPSPFDYPRQAVLAVPTDLPLPEEPSYGGAVAEAMKSLTLAAQGRTFLLFTSYGALNRTHRQIAADLESAGLVVLRQGTSSREQLLERFKETPGAVLFGTASFWEGVDVPGDRLVLVVIARLPFAVPTEPLQQARAEAVERRGGNPFRELQLPLAVLKLTQGFGRLIRTSHDQGVVAVLDRRLLARWYGRVFFESLPPVRIEASPLLDLLPTIRPLLA